MSMPGIRVLLLIISVYCILVQNLNAFSLDVLPPAPSIKWSLPSLTLPEDLLGTTLQETALSQKKSEKNLVLATHFQQPNDQKIVFVLQGAGSEGSTTLFSASGVASVALINQEDIAFVVNDGKGAILVTGNDEEYRVDIIHFTDDETLAGRQLTVIINNYLYYKRDSYLEWWSESDRESSEKMLKASQRHYIELVYSLIDEISGLFLQLIAPEQYRRSQYLSGERPSATTVCRSEDYPCSQPVLGPSGVHARNWLKIMGGQGGVGRQCPGKGNAPNPDKPKVVKKVDRKKKQNAKSVLVTTGQVIKNLEGQGQDGAHPLTVIYYTLLETNTLLDPALAKALNHLVTLLKEQPGTKPRQVLKQRMLLYGAIFAMVYFYKQSFSDNQAQIDELTRFLLDNGLAFLNDLQESAQDINIAEFYNAPKASFQPPDILSGTEFPMPSNLGSTCKILELLFERRKDVEKDSQQELFINSSIVFVLRLSLNHQWPEADRKYLAWWLDKASISRGWREIIVGELPEDDKKRLSPNSPDDPGDVVEITSPDQPPVDGGSHEGIPVQQVVNSAIMQEANRAASEPPFSLRQPHMTSPSLYSSVGASSSAQMPTTSAFTGRPPPHLLPGVARSLRPGLTPISQWRFPPTGTVTTSHINRAMPGLFLWDRGAGKSVFIQPSNLVQSFESDLAIFFQTYEDVQKPIPENSRPMSVRFFEEWQQQFVRVLGYMRVTPDDALQRFQYLARLLHNVQANAARRANQ